MIRLANTPIGRELLSAIGSREVDLGIELFTEELLRRAGVTKPPIDLAAVAALFGISEISYARIPCEGALIPTSATSYRAVISSEARRSRQRFSLAHEIGHAIIHSLVPETKKFETRTVFLPPGHAAEERLCDLFASRLLMPHTMIAELCGSRTLSVSLIQDVASKFACSLSAAALRCRGLFRTSASLLHFSADVAEECAIFQRRLIGFPRSRFDISAGQVFELPSLFATAAVTGEGQRGWEEIRAGGVVYDLFADVQIGGSSKTILALVSPVDFSGTKFVSTQSV